MISFLNVTYFFLSSFTKKRQEKKKKKKREKEKKKLEKKKWEKIKKIKKTEQNGKKKKDKKREGKEKKREKMKRQEKKRKEKKIKKKRKSILPRGGWKKGKKGGKRVGGGKRGSWFQQKSWQRLRYINDIINLFEKRRGENNFQKNKRKGKREILKKIELNYCCCCWCCFFFLRSKNEKKNVRKVGKTERNSHSHGHLCPHPTPPHPCLLPPKPLFLWGGGGGGKGKNKNKNQASITRAKPYGSDSLRPNQTKPNQKKKKTPSLRKLPSCAWARRWPFQSIPNSARSHIHPSHAHTHTRSLFIGLIKKEK